MATARRTATHDAIEVGQRKTIEHVLLILVPAPFRAAAQPIQGELDGVMDLRALGQQLRHAGQQMADLLRGLELAFGGRVVLVELERY
ncbi:hypothetical protein OOT46_24650 [Aquabacterium sp. A7-Y]|uniref:hypothetical protein n=1 Tax=Aquabacterium sp. A7-Y TaxID=1349605 RepID=UPI00223CE2BB|nr:hypothetical protein [Aquabacterium sp. A7-Y]MCW7541016.1 hypothetical protein [Aquabacterium sp. A7-Y]